MLVTKIPIRNLASVILAIVFLSSCSPVYYAPLTSVAPDLDEEGDLSIGGSLIAAEAEGLSFNAAYSPANNIGLFMRASKLSHTYTKVTEIQGSSRGFGDLGIPQYRSSTRTNTLRNYDFGVGYYSSIKPWLLFKGYLVYGEGSFNGRSSRNRSISLHPSLVLKLKFLELGLHPSLKFLKYGTTNVHTLSTYNRHMIHETFCSAKLRFKHFALKAEVGASENLTHADFKQGDAVLNLGMNFNLNTLGKGK